MSYFSNSEDPDKMQHEAAFRQSLHCFVKLKRFSGKKYSFF